MREAVGGRDDLAGWLVWIKRTCGTQPCICRYEWKGLGRLYGSSMGEGWVRMTTEPDCLEHGKRRRDARPGFGGLGPRT